MVDEDKKIRFPPELPVVDAAGTKPVPESPDNDGKTDRLLISMLPGIILILLGGLFLLSHYGYLEGQWWQYFLVGLGIVLLVETSLQYSSAPRRAKISRLVSGIVLVIFGALFLFEPNQWWPLVLIGTGIILDLNYLWRRSRNKSV